MTDRYDVSNRFALFPASTRLGQIDGQQRMLIADCDLTQLAEAHGTPLYLYDEASLQAAVDAYRLALARFYPAESGITYAGKRLEAGACGEHGDRHLHAFGLVGCCGDGHARAARDTVTMRSIASDRLTPPPSSGTAVVMRQVPAIAPVATTI